MKQENAKCTRLTPAVISSNHTSNPSIHPIPPFIHSSSQPASSPNPRITHLQHQSGRSVENQSVGRKFLHSRFTGGPCSPPRIALISLSFQTAHFQSATYFSLSISVRRGEWNRSPHRPLSIFGRPTYVNPSLLSPLSGLFIKWTMVGQPIHTICLLEECRSEVWRLKVNNVF